VTHTSCSFPPDTISTWESRNEILGSKYKKNITIIGG
jgi:hypothetical protein